MDLSCAAALTLGGLLEPAQLGRRGALQSHRKSSPSALIDCMNAGKCQVHTL
jgi:hypothetical protein